MRETLSETLEGKPVVGTDGTIFGTLATITVNVESGALCDLVIKPEKEHASTVDSDSEAKFLVPMSQVESVSDRIVVDDV